MTEGTRGTRFGGYCGNCGSHLSTEDRFCGVCGSVVSSVAGEDAQTLPKPEAARQNYRPSHNRSLLIVGLVCTLFVLLLGGAAFALIRDSPADDTAQNDSPTPPDNGESDDSSGSPPVTTAPEETVQEDTGTASESPSGTTAPTTEEEARQAVEDYYEAVNDDDWAYTYSRLASGTQALFTENQWARRSQWFEETSPTNSTPVSVDVQGTSEEPYAEVEREMAIEDTGDNRITETRFVLEDGEWVQEITGETLDAFMPDSSFEEFIEANGGSTDDPAYITGEEGYVEQTIEDYYQYIEDNNFDEAYSLRSSGYQNDNPQSEWIEEWESFDVQNVTINSIEITEIGDSSATAIVDGSFVDNTDLPRLEFTWGFVLENGTWKLDEMLDSEEVD